MNIKEQVNNLYNQHKNTISDINEHLETLYNLSKECEHITECGVRTVVSTWAFIKGLMENDSPNKRLISVDLDYSQNIEQVKSISKLLNINFHSLLETIKNNQVPYILIEIDKSTLQQNGSSEQEVRNLIENLGYDAYLLDPNSAQPVKLESGMSVISNSAYNILFSLGNKVV